MTRISVRWRDLGSPTKAGTYRYGVDLIDVTLGDIERSNGNPDAVFTAIHPDFYSREAPFLLTYVEFPGQVVPSQVFSS
jgi:hypothetical protein